MSRQKIAAALDAAQVFAPGTAPTPREPEPMATTALDPDPGEHNAQGVGAGQWLPGKLGLPDDCPVETLGYEGDMFFFLDTAGQIRALKDKDFGQKTITALFMGRAHYLYWAWPRFNAKGEVVSYRAEKVSEDLMAACHAKGPWSPADRVRGRGAWVGGSGGLIYHCGTELWIYGRPRPTGVLGRYVYPKRPQALQPWPSRIDEDGNPVRLLLPLLRRWNWARPDLDPILLTGWIGAAMLGGALPWRPMVYLTGDKGTGKSTLQSVIKRLFGDSLISTTNTTAAGIYQRIGQDSLPVAIDEFEGRDDNRRAKAILELARQASSGGQGLRGGDKHVGTEFRISNCFLFSSINAPPLEPQDLSRMALLRLRKIDPSLPPPTTISEQELALLGRDGADERGVLTDEDLGRMGSMVLRRLIDGWPTYLGTLEAYRAELREAGHDGRGQDTYGTLLACASIMIGDAFEDLKVPMGEDLTIWRERLAASEMAEFEDAVENWRLCLSQLLTAPVEAWRGGAKLTIGRVLQQFYEREEGATYSDTRNKLEQAGVALVKPDVAGGTHWLGVPNQDPLLYHVFKTTKWGGEPGAGTWKDALRQGPRSSLWDTGSARINGDLKRCTLISLDALYGQDGMMVDRKRDPDGNLLS